MGRFFVNMKQIHRKIFCLLYIGTKYPQQNFMNFTIYPFIVAILRQNLKNIVVKQFALGSKMLLYQSHKICLFFIISFFENMKKRFPPKYYFLYIGGKYLQQNISIFFLLKYTDSKMR